MARSASRRGASSRTTSMASRSRASTSHHRSRMSGSCPTASTCRRAASASRACRPSRRPCATRSSPPSAHASAACRSATSSRRSTKFVIPAKAGIQGRQVLKNRAWTPAFAGATNPSSGGREDLKFLCSSLRIRRRAAIELGLGLALAPRFVLAQTDAARERPKEGDLLVAVTAAAAPEPLKPDDVPLDGKQTLAWPMDPETKTLRNGSRLNKVLLLRLDPEGFDPETRERAAEGVVGYSAICPHTGCDVTNWHPDRQLLECPRP